MHLSLRLCAFVTLCSLLEFYKSFIFMYYSACSCSLHIFTQLPHFGCPSFVFLLPLLLLWAGLRVFNWLLHLRHAFPSPNPNHEGLLWKGNSTTLSGDHCLDDDDDEFYGVEEEFEEDEDHFRGVQEGFEEEEDEVSSVMALRQMVKAQRRRADAALRDLDKERMAAASAADEAMAMIFRLQNEKSSLRIEANQLVRSVEEKQVYDHQVVQSLQWSLMQYEEETCAMQQELDLCNKRLEVYEHDNLTPSFASPCTPCFRIGSLD